MKSIHHGDPELAEFRVFSLKNLSQRPPRLGGAIFKPCFTRRLIGQKYCTDEGE
jgi:hypothetical protein